MEIAVLRGAHLRVGGGRRGLGGAGGPGARAAEQGGGEQGGQAGRREPTAAIHGEPPCSQVGRHVLRRRGPQIGWSVVGECNESTDAKQFRGQRAGWSAVLDSGGARNEGCVNSAAQYRDRSAGTV